MCGVVWALTKGYALFQIVEQVSFFRKPKRLPSVLAHITTRNNSMCKIIQKCEVGVMLGAYAQ